MRTLKQALNDHDLVILRVIGEWWGAELTGSDKPACVKILSEGFATLDVQQEVQFLPPEENAAMQDLAKNNGRIPVATFERSHGEVRMMGPGALEREEPWFDPISPAEALWYRGFLYRGFDETAEGVIEFYFMPNEFMAHFPKAAPKEKPASKAVQKETTEFKLDSVAQPDKPKTAVTDAVDDLTTLLALAQSTSFHPDKLDKLDALLLNPDHHRRSLLINLAREMGMLRELETGIRPTKTAVTWLQKSREAQLRDLADAWTSSNWNDLCHTPELACEGDHWQNDPLLARTGLLDALPNTFDWFAIEDLTQAIKSNDPDFQRPDGNYETWYVRDVATDVYLNGFESWDLVEGRLIGFLIQGPMFWLGLTETAVSQGKAVYHLTDRALEWLANVPVATQEVKVPLVVQKDATIIAPHNADRYFRFQVARISETEAVKPGQPYTYRITPSSLATAKQQGIEPDRILTFLQEASERPLPMSTKRGIERWAERGVEAKMETMMILRVREAGILETLRNNPKTRDYIGQSLGDLAAVVKMNDWQKLRTAAAQLGLLLDADG